MNNAIDGASVSDSDSIRNSMTSSVSFKRKMSRIGAQLPELINKVSTKLKDIDFVGSMGKDTFSVSQLNILQARSLEPFGDEESLLSARGHKHRSKDHFLRSRDIASHKVNEALKKVGKDSTVEVSVTSSLFQRALANEKLGDIDKAISDYTKYIKLVPSHAAALFNRAGLYQSKGKTKRAIADLNRAIYLEPDNMQFRTQLAKLFRSAGKFLEAVEETLVCLSVEHNPSLKQELRAGFVSRARVDADSLPRSSESIRDPLVEAVKKPCSNRTLADLESIISFVSTVTYFSNFSNDREVLTHIAQALEMHTYVTDAAVFHEGDPGSHFYMILDGEFSIIKEREGRERIVFRKLYRGSFFGETALDPKKSGLRTAGAVCTSKVGTLLSLEGNVFLSVTKNHRRLMHEEVMSVLRQCKAFETWGQKELGRLADAAELKFYAPASVIQTAGQSVSHLYIIKNGLVEVRKAIEKPVFAAANMQTLAKASVRHLDSEVPGLWVLEKNWKNRIDTFDRAVDGSKNAAGDDQSTAPPNGTLKHKMSTTTKSLTEKYNFTVGIIGTGQIFGELAVLGPEIPSPTSAVSYTTIEVYAFESRVLLELGAHFHSVTSNVLNESLNLRNPPPDKIAYCFRAKVKWDKKKDLLVNGMRAERETKKMSSAFYSKR